VDNVKDKKREISEYIVAMVACGKTIDSVLQDAEYYYKVDESEIWDIADIALVNAGLM